MRLCWSSDVCSRSEEHTSELQSHDNLVCRLLLEKKIGRALREQRGGEVPGGRAHTRVSGCSASAAGAPGPPPPWPSPRVSWSLSLFFFAAGSPGALDPFSPPRSFPF